MTIKRDVSGSEGDGKAKWDDKKIEIFLKVCVEEILAGNRPSSHFSKEGWKNVGRKFHERTGHDYSRIQLKNRWDALRREFASFAKLVEKETGLGWDHEKKTIQAPEEWWTDKGKEDPDILKWKNGGPKFLELQEKCFKGTVATGFAVLTPYQDLQIDERGNIQSENNESIPVDEDEDVGDSCEVGNRVEPTMEPSSANINVKKRKIARKGEKKVGVADKLQESLDRIIEGMDKPLTNTIAIGAKPDDPFSYDKCLSMIDEVPGLVKGSSQYFLAMRILANKENRVAFCHLMKNDRDMTIGWLGTFTNEDIPRSRR